MPLFFNRLTDSNRLYLKTLEAQCAVEIAKEETRQNSSDCNAKSLIKKCLLEFENIRELSQSQFSQESTSSIQDGHNELELLLDKTSISIAECACFSKDKDVTSLKLAALPGEFLLSLCDRIFSGNLAAIMLTSAGISRLCSAIFCERNMYFPRDTETLVMRKLLQKILATDPLAVVKSVVARGFSATETCGFPEWPTLQLILETAGSRFKGAEFNFVELIHSCACLCNPPDCEWTENGLSILSWLNEYCPQATLDCFLSGRYPNSSVYFLDMFQARLKATHPLFARLVLSLASSNALVEDDYLKSKVQVWGKNLIEDSKSITIYKNQISSKFQL